MQKNYDIVSIGHVTNDVKNIMGTKNFFTGGAAFFSSFAAKKSGADVLVITKTAEKDARILAPLRGAGIDVISYPSPYTTSMENAFLTGDMDKRSLNLISVADSFSLHDIPDNINAEVFHLGGLFYGEIPEELIIPLASRGKLALDLQSVLRRIENGNIEVKDWAAKKTYMPYIHYLKADIAEMKIITNTDNKEKAAQMLFEWGAKEIVITEQNELFVFDGKNCYRSPFTPSNQSGRIGRGDTCFLSYIARRLSHDISDSVRYSAALTSIKMETEGPFNGNINSVLERMKT